jgi:hypothetical protein
VGKRDGKMSNIREDEDKKEIWFEKTGQRIKKKRKGEKKKKKTP